MHWIPKNCKDWFFRSQTRRFCFGWTGVWPGYWNFGKALPASPLIIPLIENSELNEDSRVPKGIHISPLTYSIIHQLHTDRNKEKRGLCIWMTLNILSLARHLPKLEPRIWGFWDCVKYINNMCHVISHDSILKNELSGVFKLLV